MTGEELQAAAERSADLDALVTPHPEWFDVAMRVPRKQRDVDVEGSPVRVYEWGNPDRPGVVLAHGFMAHAHCLAFLAPLLCDRFHVVAYDLSGMGDSPMHPHFEPELRGRELLAVARSAGLFSAGCPPFIVAHSQGGHSGMSAIEMEPGSFGGLVVCDMMLMRPTVAERYFGSGRRISQPPKEVRPHKVHPDRATILRRYKLAPPQPCENDYLLEYVAHHSVRKVEGGYVWKFDPAVRITDAHPADWWTAQPQRLADLEIRKAIVHGEHSRIFPADSVAHMRELTGGSMPIVGVPDAHHHLMLNQPIALAGTLRAILEGWLADDARRGPGEASGR